MPSLIAKLFGVPKMRDYNYSVMLNTEENFAEKYNTKAGKLTVYKLNQGIIESIQFIDASELAGVFN